jgi:predicted SAM-dependent methyltransferase
MRYLNVGCGDRYNKGPDWVNVDIESADKSVITHNLKNGIPFSDETFDLVYHSHVFEHIPKSDADFFISECVRVLRPGGVLRVVIPDLEQIALNYLRLLGKGISNPESKEVAADYDWIMLEMYDQTVREIRGGEMAKYFQQDDIINEEFVFSRVGKAAKSLREFFLNSKNTKKYVYMPLPLWKRVLDPKLYFLKIKTFFLKNELKKIKNNSQALEIGKFRLSGEVHQWMYDRYSISRILIKHGLREVKQFKSNESYIIGWNNFNLDTEPDGSTYKPDSLYMEAVKK